MSTRDEIVLITRLKTVNKGNQALSAAWLDMVQRAFPSTPIRLLERRPPHLLQYTLHNLARERDPFSAFDAIATQLAASAPGPELAGDTLPPARIALDEETVPPARFLAFRQRLNLRGRLARFGHYSDTYARRLSAFQRARLVVVNPAGEFFPREPAAAFYHLLDAYVAHKLGRPTAIVNHTMDITDPTLRAIIPLIYRELALVGFRDDKSVGAFRAMGGDTRNVLVTPDLALTIEARRQTVRRAATVAVAINVPEATANGYLEQWFPAIADLKAAGFEIVLVSNELPVDHAFYQRLLARFPFLRLEGEGLDHDRYAELLSSYEVVVSSRMHTLVLAMVGGTPVVPVEGSSFKITGLFQELGFGSPVIQPASEHWTKQVVARVSDARTGRAALSDETIAKVKAARDRIVSVLVPRLRALTAPASITTRIA